jgi:hypothetical protein
MGKSVRAEIFFSKIKILQNWQRFSHIRWSITIVTTAKFATIT